MYFWNAKALADKLKKDELTEDEKVHYLLVRIALVGIWFNLPNATFTLRDEFFVIFNQLLIIAISVIGIFFVARINRRGDNKDFIVRYVCLSVPSSMQVFAFTLPILFFLTFLSHNLSGNLLVTFITLLINDLVQIVWFVWIARKIRYVSGA